jgi:hypothetical protein
MMGELCCTGIAKGDEIARKGAAFACRQDQDVAAEYAKVCALALQAASLQERLRRPPNILPYFTASLKLEQALLFIASSIQEVCPADSFRITFLSDKLVRAHGSETHRWFALCPLKVLKFPFCSSFLAKTI